MQRAALVAPVAIVLLWVIAQAGRAQNVSTAYTATRQKPSLDFDAGEAKTLSSRGVYYSPEAWTLLAAWAARQQAFGERAFEATELPTDEHVITVDRTSKPRFGFNGSQAGGVKEGWFYDYFAYSPTFYTKPNSETSLYGAASRYDDLDNDGVYDRLSRFWDSDFNGSYDAHELVAFTPLSDDDDRTTAANRPRVANLHTVNGTIDAMKAVQVNGAGHLLVLIRDVQSIAGANINANIPTTVDLGAIDLWTAQSVLVGEQLTATGTVEPVGDKQVVIAETVTVGSDKQRAIPRAAPTLKGRIVDVTSAEINGAPHTFAIVKADSALHIVDVGPTDRLRLSLEPEMTFSVQGMPVRVYDQSVIFADRIYCNGTEVAVQRW